MEMKLSRFEGRIPGAVLRLEGDLDASNFLSLIEKVREAYADGVRALVLDLGGSRFVSSSGLVAIHSASLVMQGKAAPDPNEGWSAIRMMEDGAGAGARECLKIANPQPRVDATLEKVGFKEALDVYPTVEAAIASI